MSLKYLFLLISTLVLLQSALGHPNTDGTVVKAANTFTDSQNSKRNALFDYTGGAFFRKLYSYLRRAKTILSNSVEKNNKLSKEAVDEFNNYINLIETKSNEEVEKCSVDLETKYNFRQEVLQMLAKYESYEIDGLPQLKIDFASELGTFLQDFKTRSYAFWNSLSDEEKTAESKFKNWCEQLVAEQDVEKKFHMFLDLFKIYKYKYAVRCL